MRATKEYTLNFLSRRDGLKAHTHIDAEDDASAIEKAVERIARRDEEGLVGEHTLIDSGGRVIHIPARAPELAL